MKKNIQNYLKYTHACNLDMIVLLTPENNRGNVARFMSHTINVQHIWNKRLEESPTNLGVWQEHDIMTLEQLEHENFETSIRLLAKLDLDMAVTFEDTRGITFTKNIGDIFFHIINHSTYHRGQLMLALKNVGVTPIGLDFIHYTK